MIIDQYKKMKNLFLRQSYIDAWEDYQRSIRKRSFAQWDYIVLTASNEEQANAFQSQITYRQNKNVLPCKTKYLVLPDPDGKRVGSGGATLQVLRKLSEQEDIAGDFHNKRILVIHSGGDSKRVPQYSVCGKRAHKTGVGDFIRKTSLDEFPQFFNVLKGDSGIIGTTKKNLDFTRVSLA